MTENEALEKHKKDCRRCIDKSCMYGVDCLQKKDIEVYEELQQYRAIGTVEEVKDAYGRGYNQGTIDRAEELQKCREYGYNKAIDEAIETSSQAICVGCGYLDGHKCNYKGANCGVSKPMLETVVKALERLKGGAE